MNEAQPMVSVMDALSADEKAAMAEQAGQLYSRLVQVIGSNPRLRRIIDNHIKAVSEYSTLTAFNGNRTPDADRVLVYSDCLAAIANNDFSNLKSSVKVLAQAPALPAPPSEIKVMEAGVFIPELDPTFVVAEEHKEILRVIIESSEDAPQNLMVVGPPGAGKTSMGLYLGATYKRPVLIMDCQNIREPRDWYGHKTAENGNVFWKDARFVHAVEAGNHIIITDEINRTAPNVNNTLLPLLDERRFTYVEERRDMIKVGKGTIFFATMNQGSNFTGTNMIDDALRDRFSRCLEVNYLNPKQEADVLVKRTGINKADAKRIAEVGDAIRKKTMGIGGSLTQALSTRRLVDAARDFKKIGARALEFTITNHFSPDGGSGSERAQVLQIIQGKFPPGVV